MQVENVTEFCMFFIKMSKEILVEILDIRITYRIFPCFSWH